MKIVTDLSITSWRKPGGKPWNPQQLFQAAEGAWYDPSTASSLWQDVAGTVPAIAGQPVARIDDLSGNGHHCVQPTLAARPTLTADSQGRPCLEFDGVDDILRAPFAFDHTFATFSLGYQTTVSGENGGMAFGVGSSSGGRFYLQTSFGSTRFLRQPQDGSNLSLGGLPADVLQVASVRIGPGPDDFLARANGGLIGWHGANAQQMNLANRHIQIGARIPGSMHSAMLFYGGVYLVGALSDTELEQIEAFLATRAGVALP